MGITISFFIAVVETEIDCEPMIAYRKSLGFKPSYTTILAKAVADTLADFPVIRSSWAEDHLVIHEDIHIGIGNGHAHGLADHDLAILHHGLFGHLGHRQDRALRRRNDGVEEVHIKNAQIADGKYAAGHLLHGIQALGGEAIVAREIDRDPELLVAVQPTRGLDVGAIEYIHKQAPLGLMNSSTM